MINTEAFKEFARRQDWDALHAMLDDARDKAITADDVRSEIHWRGAALERQQRYEEALELLRSKSDVFNSKCRVQHGLACLLLKLGRDQEALDELSKAPFEAEMASHYGLAIDSKFLYIYLLSQQGYSSVKARLSEIPDDYRYITMDGEFLTKSDIAASLNALRR